MHHLLAFAVVAFTRLTSTRADCTTFTPSGSYSESLSRSVPGSRVYKCEDGKVNYPLPPNTNSSFCAAFDVKNGCSANLFGDLTVYGSTNLSLSSAAASSLYSLLPEYEGSSGGTVISPGAPAQSLCVNVNYSSPVCADSGTFFYISYEQQVVCINGTFTNCTGGPVANGTPAQMCGIVDGGANLSIIETAPSASFDNGFSPGQCTPSEASAAATSPGGMALVASLAILISLL